MERIMKMTPAYDKRNADPKKDYGIHCVQTWMVLKGERGAVHFTFSTGMFLEETWQRLAQEGALVPSMVGDHYFSVTKPMGYDVGYHARTPQHEGQEVVWPTKMVRKDPEMKDPGMDATQEERLAYLANIEFEKIGTEPPVCEWLGVPCYCDGSALRAEEWLNVLLSQGSEKVWEMLEEDYKAQFGELV